MDNKFEKNCIIVLMSILIFLMTFGFYDILSVKPYMIIIKAYREPTHIETNTVYIFPLVYTINDTIRERYRIIYKFYPKRLFINTNKMTITRNQWDHINKGDTIRSNDLNPK
jgi:hypothetical protein